jgi:uncharacterized membrane protein YtjA (UPF0391 family)
MLYYALVFLVVALIAGLLGISGVASVATNIAYVLSWHSLSRCDIA